MDDDGIYTLWVYGRKAVKANRSATGWDLPRYDMVRDTSHSGESVLRTDSKEALLIKLDLLGLRPVYGCREDMFNDIGNDPARGRVTRIPLR